MKESISTSEEVPAGAASAAGAVVMANTFAHVAGEPEYVENIHKMHNAYVAAENHVLLNYHLIGGLAQFNIDAQGSKNEDATLKKMAADLAAIGYNGKSELGISSLRKALKIYNNITEEQLDLANSAGVSLRNLLPLCNNDVTHEEREQTLKEVTDGTISQKDIPKKVKALHPPGEKNEKRGGARKKSETPLEYMARIQNEIGQLLTDMKEGYHVHAATALGSEDQATKDKYTLCFEATAEQIELLNKQWAANEKVTKVFLEE